MSETTYGHQKVIVVSSREVPSAERPARATREIRFDLGYLKTLPGILKLVQILLAIITLICAVIAHSPSTSLGIGPGLEYVYRPGHAAWAAFVSFTAFLFTTAWLVFHLFQICEMVPGLPWEIFEMVYYGIWALFLLLSGSVLAALSHDIPVGMAYSLGLPYDPASKVRSAAGAGSFFAFALMALFCVSAFLLYLEWKHRTGGRGATTVERKVDV